MIKKLIFYSILFGLFIGSVVLAQEIIPIQTGTEPAPLVLSEVVTSLIEIPNMNLQPGVRNPHVRRIQELLISLGYLPANLQTTDNFGPQTRRAMINFQRDRGLPATGFFGPLTREALRNKAQERKEKEREVVIDENVNVACMKVAVEKRENAFLAAWDIYSRDIKTAREARKTDFLAAWNMQDPKERHNAIKTAWREYREALKNTRNTWNRLQRTTWAQFNQEARNCRATIAETRDLEIIEIAEE